MSRRFGLVILRLRNVAFSARRALRDTVFAPEILLGFARIGYAARGVVYLLIGSLAAASALNESIPPSLGGALSVVSDLPAGRMLIASIALGLFAYASWRLAQATLDLGGNGWRWKGLLLRSAILIDAVLHMVFGVLVTIVALDWAGIVSGDQAMAEASAELLLDWPWGHWIVGLIGLGAIAIGAAQVAKAHRTAFDDIQATAAAMTAIRLLGRIGLGARGLISALIGASFLIAAWRVDASAAGGMRAALVAVATLPLGGWALLGVSAGLILFGLFSVLKGWCHRRSHL